MTSFCEILIDPKISAQTHLPKFLETSLNKEKEIKGSHIRKEVKLLLFADGMTLYIENPKDRIRKLLEVISESRKRWEYQTT